MGSIPRTPLCTPNKERPVTHTTCEIVTGDVRIDGDEQVDEMEKGGMARQSGSICIGLANECHYGIFHSC